MVICIPLKVNKSQKQNWQKKTSSKTERTNLFFYPDGPESPETWDFDFKFQVFPDRQERKTNSSVCFWKKFFFVNFAFEIYWPLLAPSGFSDIPTALECIIIRRPPRRRNRFSFSLITKRTKLIGTTSLIMMLVHFLSFGNV